MLVGHYVNVIIMIARHGAKIIKVNYSQVSSRRSAATEGSAGICRHLPLILLDAIYFITTVINSNCLWLKNGVSLKTTYGCFLPKYSLYLCRLNNSIALIYTFHC